MASFNIVLASRTEEENQILRRKLETLRSEFSDLRFVSLHPRGLALSVDVGTTVAILNIIELTNVEIGHINDLRASGYGGPVLVSAKIGQAEVFETLRSMPGTVFLEKPFEPKDLVGIAKKMLTAAAVEQRVHRRYPTNEMAGVEFFAQKRVVPTRLCNMSKGGAFLQCEEPVSIRIGDMLKLSLELKDVRRSYTIDARVVWTQSEGIGVEFVGVPNFKKTVFTAY